MVQSSSSVFQLLWMASIFLASLSVSASLIKKPQMSEDSQMSRLSKPQALQNNFEPDASEVNGILNGLQTDVVNGQRLQINKNSFTWAVSRRSRKLYPHSVEHELARVLKEYLKHTNLKFEQKPWYQDVDIEIKFGVHDHGCGFPFYGRGNYLAHAFLPYGDPLANIHMDVHFDDDESWSINKTTGTDFYPVALHEIGHVLGLEHTSIEESIMYPYYSEKYETLQPIDIANLQRLYAKFGRKQASTGFIGSPKIEVKRHPYKRGRSHASGRNQIMTTICSGDFDTMGYYGPHYFMFTQGSNVVLLPVGRGISQRNEIFMPDKARIISVQNMWPDIAKYTSTIDAFVDTDTKAYLFRGNLFWLVNWRRMYNNFPIQGKGITSIGLPRWSRVHAAFKSSVDEKIYIFTADRLYILDENNGEYGTVNKGTSISHDWFFLNNSPNAIVSYSNGTVIFFEKDHYTLYNPYIPYIEYNRLSTNTHLIPGCN